MKGGSSSRVPMVLATLQEGLPKLLPGGVELRDGDEPKEQPNDALILCPSDPDTPGLVATYIETRSRQPAERIEVALVARSYAGDGTMQQRRARCAEIIAAVEKFVRENPRVEDRWDEIRFGELAAWHPVYTDRGLNCYVGFSLVTIGLL